MGGNLWEWCLDTYGEYATERPGDGLRPAAGDGSSLRMRRGGGFDDVHDGAQSGGRAVNDPTTRDNNLGLRAAKTS